MSLARRALRALRPASDLLAPLAFNRAGFELDRLSFEPDDMVEDARGRVALVTGANAGIGFATSRELARRGFEVWLLCRDAGRGEHARTALAASTSPGKVQLALVDLASLSSIRRVVSALPERIDVLVHNAGLLPHDKTLTADGIEVTFATHVVGPFALTGLLGERLARSDDARVVFVASGGLYAQRLDLALPDAEASAFDGVRAYANAKRAQLILAHLLAERCAPRLPITFASMHPGWVDTEALRSSLPGFHGLMRGLLRTPEQGADTVVWLAARARPPQRNGAFWFDRRVALEYPVPFTREQPADRHALYALCQRLSRLAPAEAPLLF